MDVRGWAATEDTTGTIASADLGTGRPEAREPSAKVNEASRFSSDASWTYLPNAVPGPWYATLPSPAAIAAHPTAASPGVSTRRRRSDRMVSAPAATNARLDTVLTG